MEPQVKAGVGVVLLRENKVLIGRRKGSHGDGVYAFPGGHLEFVDAEKASQHKLGGMGVCAEREVTEETGIICNARSIDSSRVELFTTFDILSEDKQKVYVTPYILADYVSGGETMEINGTQAIKPLEPQKCDYWIWVTLEELKTLVQTEKQKTWIPVEQVEFYLKNEITV